jgi:hypothetical protein
VSPVTFVMTKVYAIDPVDGDHSPATVDYFLKID